MSRNLIIGLGVAVVAGLLLLFVIVPALQPAGTNADLDITFYDKDGNELDKATTKGLLNLGIRRAGAAGDVYSVKVRVDYTITTDIAHANRDTRCYLEVRTTLNTITGGHVHTVAEFQMGFSAALEGYVEDTYLMSTLLPASAIEDTGKANGWNMNFNVRVKTTLTLDDNTMREVEDTCTIMLRLTWSEQLELESWVALP